MLKPAERAALVVASLASFLTPFMGAATNVALPTIGREFSAGPIALTWVSASYLLAAAACLLPFGRLADLHGRKRMFAWGLLAYTVTSWLSADAGSIGQLITARALQGAAGAMIFGTNVAILTSIFPPARRGFVLGLNVAAVYVGLSLGPFVGGLLVEHYGWRSIFAINVPLGALALVLTAWKLEGEWAEAQGAPFDAAGSVLYAVALTAAMYGLSQLPGTVGAVSLVSGVALLAVFVRRERWVPGPMLDVAFLARNRVFALGSLAALINYSATFAVGFLLSLYLQYVRGFDAQEAGTILVSQPIVMTLVSPFAGRLSDRVEARVVASAGMATVAAGLFLLAFIDERTSLGFIMTALVVLGCGFGLFSSPNTNAVMGSVDRPLYGVASAMLATMRLTGQMVSMAVAMLALAAFAGREPMSIERHAGLEEGLRAAFLMFAVFCAAGVFPSLARGRGKGPRFIADVHLGRLASYLRLAGFDTAYEPPWDDAVLARKSAEEGRTLLTRDRGLLERSIVTSGYFVSSTHPREQFTELLDRFDLRRLMRPFTRCARCNTLLRPVPKAAVLDRLLPRTRMLHDDFVECPSCRRVYWRGSHHARIASWFDRA